MNWFTGDISVAIQKAIKEKKVFIVFVKGDNDDSKLMESTWHEEEIATICCEDKCVSINISSDTTPGHQFSSIYPILNVPSTYLINNEGIPIDIIPGVLQKDEFSKRLQDGINNILQLNPTDDLNVTTEVDAGSRDINETETAEEPPKNNASSKDRAEQLLQNARAIKAEKEKELLKENERKRRDEGRELSMAKRDLAERQAQKLAKEISDRKAEEKAAREKVKEQIRLDRAEKNAKRELEKKAKADALKKKTKEKEITKIKPDSNEARVQFRLPDGSTVTNTFPADAMFTTVQVFAKEQVKNTYPVIRLTTVFPKREFTHEHSSSTLRELQLVPNGSIIVSPGRVSSTPSSSLNPYNIIMLVLSPIFALFNFILSIFRGSDQSSTTHAATPQRSSTEASADSARAAAVRRRQLGGNIAGLRRDDDDENATWNGNSTQQM